MVLPDYTVSQDAPGLTTGQVNFLNSTCDWYVQDGDAHNIEDNHLLAHIISAVGKIEHCFSCLIGINANMRSWNISVVAD